MEDKSIEQLVLKADSHPDYKIIRRYKRPSFYHVDDLIPKKIGVFLDIEATGLSHIDDKLIELGMVKFEYTSDGKIYRILEEFNEYQDPKVKISEFITGLTGISDDMVSGKKIDSLKVANFLSEVDIIIAHNAKFDRAFFEMTFPDVPVKSWGCSMFDISWKSEGIESHKLEYIAYKHNFFYEGHRAIIDCLVGIHVLSNNLENSNQLALHQLLNNSMQPRYKLWAKQAPYDCKDQLRERGYRWGVHPEQNFKAWSIELTEGQVEEEICYLKDNIYHSKINIPIDILDAESRFSIKNSSASHHDKYQDKIRWLNILQQ